MQDKRKLVVIIGSQTSQEEQMISELVKDA